MHFRLVQMTRRMFGSTSERHHPDQQALDEIMRHVLVENALVPDETMSKDATAAGVVAGAATTPGHAQPPKEKQKDRKKGRGRLTLPDHLPIEDRPIEVPESERLGPDGTPLPQVGAEITWKLDYRPALVPPPAHHPPYLYRSLLDVFAKLHEGRTNYDQLRPKAWAQRPRSAA